LLVDNSHAIPSLTPHLHNAQATTWNPPGADDMSHQHRDNHELVSTRFDVVVPAKDSEPAYGFAPVWVWDNRNERYDFAADSSLRDFGHGYIADGNDIRYKFVHGENQAGDWNTDIDAKAMKVVIKKAFETWMTAVNGDETNTNNIPIRIRIGFEEVAANQAADVIVTLGQVTGNNIGEYFPKAKEMSFKYSANFWDYDPSDGITAQRSDFSYVALHEIGHLLGLDHYGADPLKNLMNGDVLPKGTKGPGIDVGSLHGVKDMYAIAVPEPAVAGFLLLALEPYALARIVNARQRVLSVRIAAGLRPEGAFRTVATRGTACASRLGR
jgi:Matrixin